MSEEINHSLNTEIDVLKKLLEDANAIIANLEKNLKDKEKELSDLSKFTNEKISSLSTELENGKRKISVLEKSLNEVNRIISAKDEDLEELRAYQSKFETSVEESNKLKAEFDDLKNKMSIIEEENAKLTSQLVELNNLLLQKDSGIEELKAKLFMLQPPEILTGDVTTEGRVKCVNCGAVGKDVKVVEDKSRVLSYVGNIPMYAKKHVCKKCGYEF